MPPLYYRNRGTSFILTGGVLLEWKILTQMGVMRAALKSWPCVLSGSHLPEYTTRVERYIKLSWLASFNFFLLCSDSKALLFFYLILDSESNLLRLLPPHLVLLCPLEMFPHGMHQPFKVSDKLFCLQHCATPLPLCSSFTFLHSICNSLIIKERCFWHKNHTVIIIQFHPWAAELYCTR